MKIISLRDVPNYEWNWGTTREPYRDRADFDHTRSLGRDIEKPGLQCGIFTPKLNYLKVHDSGLYFLGSGNRFNFTPIRNL